MLSDVRARMAFLTAIALMLLTLLVMVHEADSPRPDRSSASSGADR